MFEPVHGSAPKYAGTGKANPFGAILTAGLLLDHLGHGAEAAAVEAAVGACVKEGAATADVGGSLSTSAAGDAVCDRLRL
jgi:3-isopropylmalate dehydrogenase